MILNISFSGLVLLKIAEEAITIIESVAFTDMRSQSGRTQAWKRGVVELNSQDALLSQHKFLSQQIDVLNQ